MNAVIYARYSSDNQREESIEGQLRECNEYAVKNGLTIVGNYIDRALSAKTDNRPEFQQMIKDSSRKKFEVIIVWKLDRFARNRVDSAKYRTALCINGVKLLSATENIADNSTGVLLESILEGFAEYYSADLSEKVVRGLTENALKCKYNGGGIPVGYVIDENQMFQIDNVNAPAVLEAFQKYADGSTIKDIMEFLELKGVKNYKNNFLRLDAVKNMLKNRRYIGEYSYRDIVTPNGIPAIVPEELFEKVQERIAKNAKAPARFKAKADMYLLTTKLYCGKCGKFMVGESGTSRNKTFHQYYKCHSVKNKLGCDKKTVKKDYIENIVVNQTIKMLDNDEIIESIVDNLMALQKKENTAIPRIKKQISETNKSINNILNAMEQGIFTSSTKERLEQLEDSKKSLEISLAQEEIARPVLSREQIYFWFEKYKNADYSTYEQKQNLIDNFVNAIYLYDDKLVIIYNPKKEKITIPLDLVNGSDLTVDPAPVESLDTHFA